MTDSEIVRQNVYECPVTGCWLWKGIKDTKGYGVVVDNGIFKGLASTFIWNMSYVRQMLKGYPFLDCGNTKCVNPAHMKFSMKDSGVYPQPLKLVVK